MLCIFVLYFALYLLYFALYICAFVDMVGGGFLIDIRMEIGLNRNLTRIVCIGGLVLLLLFVFVFLGFFFKIILVPVLTIILHKVLRKLTLVCSVCSLWRGICYKLTLVVSNSVIKWLGPMVLTILLQNSSIFDS